MIEVTVLSVDASPQGIRARVQFTDDDQDPPVTWTREFVNDQMTQDWLRQQCRAVVTSVEAIKARAPAIEVGPMDLSTQTDEEKERAVRDAFFVAYRELQGLEAAAAAGDLRDAARLDELRASVKSAFVDDYAHDFRYRK